MNHILRAMTDQPPELRRAGFKAACGQHKARILRSGGRYRVNSLWVGCAFGLWLLSAGQVSAADCNWLGQSDDWFDSINWESCAGGAPVADDNVTIDQQGSFDPIVHSGASAESGNVFLRYNGALTVNGQLNSGAGLIGDLDHPTSVATVRVEGGNAAWFVHDFLSVGRESQGALEITGGAEVTVSGNGLIGEAFASVGTVKIDGAGSSWDIGDRLLVGVLGTGTLNASNGAQVLAATEVIIGDQESGSGNVEVNASSLTSDGLLYVGNHGNGHLDIRNGGTVKNGYGTAGFYEGSHGEINVDGAGSSWRSSEEINIGNYGEGSLSVTGGGRVSGQSNSRIGNYAASIGEVLVDGTGSHWTNAGDLYVGRIGTGTLSLSNGGNVEVADGGELVLADDARSTGTLNIGAELGAAPVAPGTVSAGSLVFGDGDGTLVFNHTDTSYTFAPDISGNGTIRQEAGTTNYTGDSSEFSGEVIVSGGDFNAEGALGEKVHVELGANVVMTIPAALISPHIEVSGDGDLFKRGGGELIMTMSLEGSELAPLRMTVLEGTLSLPEPPPSGSSGGEIHVGGCVQRTQTLETEEGETVVIVDLPAACFVEPEPTVTIPGLGDVVACASGTTNIGIFFLYRDSCVNPGNSIGTLGVKDKLVVEGGAIYVVELKGGGTTPGVHNDLLEVEGTAVLKDGVRIHVMPENNSNDGAGSYADGSRYVIIDAGTLIVEGSTEISDTYAFLDFTSDHDAHNFYLISSLVSDSFTLDGMTRNQTATANAAFALGAGHEIYDQVLNMDEVQVLAAMNALSGEIYASAKAALIEESRFVSNAANDRIRSAFQTAGASYAPVLAYGPGGTLMTVAADHSGPVFWSQGSGSWGSIGSDGNAAGLDHSTSGLLVGADALVGDWRVGLLAGYSRSGFKVNDRASSGSSNNYHLGLYGGTEWGAVAFRTGAAYSWHDLKTSRSVNSSGFTGSLADDYGAGIFQAFGELGYSIDLENGSHFEPFANLAHVHLSTDGFSEQGGAAALSGGGSSTEVTFTTLGIRGEHDFTVGTVDAKLRGTVGWRHAFGDTTPESTHAFSGGDAFTVAGVPLAEDSAVIEASLDLSLTSEATLGLSYQGQLASGAYDHGFKANFGVRF